MEGDSRVSALRVAAPPIAACNLRERGQNRVPHEAEPRHVPVSRPPHQPVSLRVLGSPLDDRVEEVPQHLRLHLPVAPHHGGDVYAVLLGALVSGFYRAADAAILFVLNRNDSPIELPIRSLDLRCPLVYGCRPPFDLAPRAVGRPVVDDVDAVYELGCRIDRFADESLLVVRRNNDSGRVSSVHWFRSN